MWMDNMYMHTVVGMRKLPRRRGDLARSLPVEILGIQVLAEGETYEIYSYDMTGHVRRKQM